MATTPVPLQQVVGFRLRQLRETVDCTQEDIAAAARRLGFDWARSSVSALESGVRQLSAVELLALPAILDEAYTRGDPATKDGTAYTVPLADLLLPGKSEHLALTDSLSLTRQEVTDWLSVEPPTARRVESAVHRVGEVDRKAATSLGWTAEQVMARSLVLWGRQLSDERDARLAEAEGDARSLQARRGHVTRQLLAELKEANRGKH